MVMTSDQHELTLEIPIVLRIATQADLPKLEWHGQYTHYRHLFRRTFREQQLGHRLMLLADFNGFPVGQIFILFKATRHYPADGVKRAYLYSLRVMEMFRGKSIGTRLIQEAERLALERGFTWASIAVAKDNPGAHRLYERLGFQTCGEDPGNWSYVDHQGRTHQVHEPCWILEKRLIPQ